MESKELNQRRPLEKRKLNHLGHHPEYIFHHWTDTKTALLENPENGVLMEHTMEEDEDWVFTDVHDEDDE